MKIKKYWFQIRQFLKKKWVLGISAEMLLVFFTAMLVIPALQFSADITNTSQFCSYCHLKMDTVVQEYQQSTHYNNRLGIRAECKDCHIPSHFLPALKVKVKGLKDTVYYLTETLTPDDFESRRWDMFEQSLKTIREQDSSTCRNCHDTNSMSTSVQTRLAALKHTDERYSKKTCVDCHTGLAHKTPELDLLDIE